MNKKTINDDINSIKQIKAGFNGLIYAKTIKIYCSKCGYQFDKIKWNCPECGEWKKYKTEKKQND